MTTRLFHISAPLSGLPSNINTMIPIDSLKKNNLEKASLDLEYIKNFVQLDRFDKAILESLKQYIFVFKEKSQCELLYIVEP